MLRFMSTANSLLFVGVMRTSRLGVKMMLPLLWRPARRLWSLKEDMVKRFDLFICKETKVFRDEKIILVVMRKFVDFLICLLIN